MEKERLIKRYRSSESGQFVTKAHNDRNPKVSYWDTMELDQKLAYHEGLLLHICEGMRSAAPEEIAEWALWGIETLQELRAELIQAEVSP